MLLSELIATLKLTIDDTGETALLSNDQYESIMVRSLGKAAGYLSVSFVAESGVVNPTPSPAEVELIQAQALVFLSETMRAKVARNFAFKSGDKSVDKTKQPTFWADLHKDYLVKLKEILTGVAPGFEQTTNYGSVSNYPLPEIYEISRDA